VWLHYSQLSLWWLDGLYAKALQAAHHKQQHQDAPWPPTDFSAPLPHGGTMDWRL